MLFKPNHELLIPIDCTGNIHICNSLTMGTKEFQLREGTVLYQAMYINSYEFSQVFWLGKARMNSENSVFQ